MTFEHNGPWELQLVLRGGEVSAEDVVHIPDEETANKSNDGYLSQILVWPSLETKSWAPLTNQCQRPHLAHDPAADDRISLPKLRPQLILHNIEAAENGGGSDKSKSHLMEHWVFRIKVVDLDTSVSSASTPRTWCTYSDKDTKSNHDRGNQKLSPRGSLVGECGIAHDKDGINHGQLIGQLHLV